MRGLGSQWFHIQKHKSKSGIVVNNRSSGRMMVSYTSLPSIPTTVTEILKNMLFLRIFKYHILTKNLMLQSKHFSK